MVSDLTGGSIELAETLLAFGADFNVRMDGDTLLHVAADTGDLPMMTWLLDKGADVNARNGCEHPDEAICNSGAFVDWQPVDRRRASGTVCTGCDHDGQTPLHAAQRSSRAYEGSTLLLSRGADVHAFDAAGRTALHIAGQEARGSQDPRVLCAYGADPRSATARGKYRQISLARPRSRSQSTAILRPAPVSSPAGFNPRAAVPGLPPAPARDRPCLPTTWMPRGGRTMHSRRAILPEVVARPWQLGARCGNYC